MKINNDHIDSVENSEEKYFSYRGCDNCNNKLGNDVYECKAHINLAKENQDYYEIELCGQCLCSYHNADPLDEYCNNFYNI